MSDQPQCRIVPRLTPVQRRVLGVLIEKSLTTPGGYPLTLNSMVTGSNQLTCREPVMQLSENEIARAVHDLEILSGGPLVRQAETDRSARASRFAHNAEARLGWDKRQRAIMAELLLRGPQTAGELKTNASRMAQYDDLQMVMNILGDLARHDPPFVVELPRQPGRNTVRFDHTLYAEPPDAPTRTHAAAATYAPAPGVDESVTNGSLADRVTQLESEVSELRLQMEDLKRIVNGLSNS